MTNESTKNPKYKKALESDIGNNTADNLSSDSNPRLFYSPENEMERGWVKNYRKIKDWEWYKTPNMAHLLQHLIREANHKEKKWQGILIKRGQLVTSRKSLSQETGLTIQQTRTCLKNLKKSQNLTIKTTNKYSIITICNYDKYQNNIEAPNQQPNKQLTSNQPATNQQPNHKQEVKNVNNDNKNRNISKDILSVGVCPHQKIIDTYHEILTELPHVKEWPPHMQAILRARWKENPERQSVDWWVKFFEYVKASPFLMGKVSSSFKADLEWLVRPKNFTKIANGRYHKNSSLDREYSENTIKTMENLQEWLNEKSQEIG